VQRVRVARRLDQPGEVHRGVGAREERREFVRRDVGRGPGRLRERHARAAPGDAHDGLDPRLVRERGEHARPDVAGCSENHDAHPPFLAVRAARKLSG
jgi:hypothetical protein